MILTAHQPVYLPWLGLFHKIYLAETFCLFDIAQYQTKDFNNRNKIKTNSGPIWLTVPVNSKEHFNKKICDIRIQPDPARRKHIKSIRFAYAKAPYFDSYYPAIEELLSRDYTFLTDLNYDMLKYFMEALGINRTMVKASDYSFTGSKSNLVLDMCVKLGADKYIFGALGKDYAEKDEFQKQGVDIYFQDYQHPAYVQQHGDFAPYMSIVDLLMNEGSNSLETLLGDNIRGL